MFYWLKGITSERAHDSIIEDARDPDANIKGSKDYVLNIGDTNLQPNQKDKASKYDFSKLLVSLG